MKKLFYPRLAWTGIRNNRRLYVPYLLTCIGVVAVFYILHFLSISPIVEGMGGGRTLAVILSFGCIVIGVFSVIFLFYTNSFLMRRRKKEFGLYNILGMNKRNIGRVLLWETLIIGILSLIIGLILGIAFSKLGEYGLTKIVEAKTSYELSISWKSVLFTSEIFTVIFALILLNSLRQVGFTNPVELIKGESLGEKPPKANLLVAVLGIVLLAAAYYISITTDDPISAMFLFFIAVVLVIIATYFLFISGSVALCRTLQKNKRYYYKAPHFVSVSSMVFRMKRNGAGLASICILATMVLVMISSTSCLHFGKGDSLDLNYPHDYCLETDFNSYADMTDEEIARTRSAINSYMNEHGGISASVQAKIVSVTGGLSSGTVTLYNDTSDLSASAYFELCWVTFVSLEDYIANTGDQITLADDEALVFSSKGSYEYPIIQVGSSRSYNMISSDSDFTLGFESNAVNTTSLCVVVNDLEELASCFEGLKTERYQNIATVGWRYQFNSPMDYDSQIEMSEELWDVLVDNHSGGCTFGCKADARADFYGTFGGLFFIGIMLSIVFIFAAVLIIYYKQISEGYEDQSRFDIMMKVGMKKSDIRKSINSQMLTVFFLPLLFAVMHLAFAFPIIYRLLCLFDVANLKLFILTALISSALFALLYVAVYRVTSNSYFKIVSGAKE